MFLYTTTEAVVAVVAGILIAACTKKADGVTYGKLDKAGRITNILLIPVYVCVSPLYLFLGMISTPVTKAFRAFWGGSVPFSLLLRHCSAVWALECPCSLWVWSALASALVYIAFSPEI